jgi:hypothetical protein
MTPTSKQQFGWMAWVAIVGAGVALGGCGYTDFEMAAKQRQVDTLAAQVNALRAGASAACRIDEQPSTHSKSSPALSSR